MTTATSSASSWLIAKLGFVACLLGLTASLLNLLNYHGYTRPGAELPILLAVLAIASGVVAGVIKLAQPRLSFVLTALLVGVLVDLNTDISRGWFFALVGAVALTAYFGEKIVLKLVIAALGSVMLFQAFTLFTSSAEKPASNEAEVRQSARPASARQLRPIVHLVLDSYLGLEGMTVPGSNFGSLREEQARFYLERGFRIYPQAYSRHVKTVNSLPYLFSYGHAPLATQTRNVQHTAPGRLDYFTDLDKRGYRISALSPSFVNFCPHQPLSECHNFNRSNLSSMRGSGLSSVERAQVIGFTLLGLSNFSASVAEFVQQQANRVLGTEWRRPYNRIKLLPLTSLAELDTVTEELGSLQFGEARIIHLLLPHDPYMLDSQCRVLPERTWLDEHGPGPLAARDEAYANHVRCLTSRLDRMLQALDRTQAGREAIVVLHGDHGSRTIDVVPYIGGPQLDTRDLALSYSAFFAIRVPSEPAAEVPGHYALDSLIGGFARSGFTRAPTPDAEPPEVFMMDAEWIPKQRVPLPDYERR